MAQCTVKGRRLGFCLPSAKNPSETLATIPPFHVTNVCSIRQCLKAKPSKAKPSQAWPPCNGSAAPTTPLPTPDPQCCPSTVTDPDLPVSRSSSSRHVVRPPPPPPPTHTHTQHTRTQTQTHTPSLPQPQNSHRCRHAAPLSPHTQGPRGFVEEPRLLAAAIQGCSCS